MSDIIHLDLGKGEVPRKTAGWTDKQIYGKTEDDLSNQIKSAKMVLDTLRSSVRQQEDRIHDLERILRRRRELEEEGYRPPEQ